MTQRRIALPLVLTALIAAFTFAADNTPDDLSKPQNPTPHAVQSDTAKSNAPADASSGKSSDKPAADRVLHDLLNKPQNNPVIEPTRPGSDITAPAKPAAPSADIAGSAPHSMQRTPLRREGTFIITRRGRMVHAVGGASPWMFNFESDSSTMADPPMYIMPCQMLEDMEQIVKQQGDQVVFVMSGQVFVYHGANYLLPTLMKLAPNRSNLQP